MRYERYTIVALLLALVASPVAAQFAVSDFRVTRLGVESTLTLDDGSGAAPTLILKDGSDETGTFGKVDGAFCTLTTEATDGLNILAGNLKVGDGTPAVTQNGEDFYVEGTSELYGAVTASNNITCASTVQAEQLTSTDDATVTDDLSVGGDVSITGAITKYKATVEDATTAVTILAADSGTVFVTGDTSSTFTLPTCASGLVYTFCINSATTHYIDCASGDRIATTNSDGDRISADAVGECVTLVGRGTSGTINWCVASMFGTWSDSN